jgi:hypothetical protein
MGSFTDNTGATWQVGIIVAHLAPLRTTFKLDLGKAVRSQADFAKLFDLPPEDLVGVLYIVCHDQIGKAG